MYFYSEEKEIVDKSLELINKYCKKMSDREKIKKLYEAFHFLTFLKIQGIRYEHIEPHEPGDFVIFDFNGEKHLYEVVTIFGNKENIEVENRLKNVFLGQLNSFVECNQYDDNEMPLQFMKCLNKKNDMPYFKTNLYKTVNLLVVASEYTRCSNCGIWLLREMQKELTDFIKIKKFKNLYFIDYAASGLDNGPIAGDLEEELRILNRYIPLNT